MVKVYSLRHMFRGLPEGHNVPILFTRDSEHLLSKLEQKVLDEAVAKGWVKVTEVPTIGEDRAAMKESTKAQQKKGGK